MRGFLPIVCGLVVIPVIAATGHAFDAGWIPTSDDAVVAVRAFDVFSSHPPLVGQYTQSWPLIGEVTYGLGPLLSWLLAIPAHVSPRSFPIVMGIVNAACLAGAVVLAHRRGGPLLALVSGLLLILATRALPVETTYDILNCWAGLFPFAFLLFLAWSVGCGDQRLLPLLVLVASFVVQVHYTYLLPALAASALAVAGLVIYRRRHALPDLRRWVIVAAAVGVVCWGAPLVEQATHRPGNMALAYRLATDDHPTTGLSTGWHTAVRAVGVPPWWAERVRHFDERILEPVQRPSVASIVAAILVVAAALILLGLAWRRGRHDLVMALALALALVVCIVLVTTNIPTGGLGFAALSYTLEWTILAGMWVWLAVGWSALALARPQLRLGTAPAVAGLVVVALVAVLVAAGRDYDDFQRLPPGVKDYRTIDSVNDRVVSALAGYRSVYVDVPASVRHALAFEGTLIYALRREGFAIGARADLVRQLGRQYRRDRGPFDQVLLLGNPSDPPAPGSRLILRNRLVSVMLKPWSPSLSRSSEP